MKHLLAAILLLSCLKAQAIGWEESEAVGALFRNAGVDGTFVLYDLAAHRFIGYDRARAEIRFVPASTYKVPHTLIGLSVGAVESVDEILPYGGRPQPFEIWEKDMALREAIRLSAVPIYQQLARRIGLSRMREHLALIGFGNQEIGSEIETFWLEGPLKISAVEQAEFLSTLAEGGLAYPEKVQALVREIILEEEGENWVLYAKTGWENVPGQGVGWWVGWVNRAGRVHAFALNMDIRQPSDARLRTELGKASLELLDVL